MGWYDIDPMETEVCEICGHEDLSLCDCDEIAHPATDSISSLIEHLGCGETIGENMRAIERHSSTCYCLGIHLRGGHTFYSSSAVDRDALDEWPVNTRIMGISVNGIAWDGSDWEFSEYSDRLGGWKFIDDALKNFEDALGEWGTEDF